MIAGNGREKRIISFAEETKVTMYPMTEEQIQAYVETKEPMDKAGAYGIQGKCAIYIEKIEGDYNNGGTSCSGPLSEINKIRH